MPITANSLQPCWVPVDLDGLTVIADENTPHYSSREAADKARKQGDFPFDQPHIGIGQLTARCWIATSECDYMYDANHGVVHFPTKDEAIRTVTDAGFVVLPDDKMVCPAKVECTCRAATPLAPYAVSILS